MQWLRDELGIIKRAPEIEALAARVPDTGGVEFVPALTGLGAPYWDPDARGVISGLTRGSSAAHIARATLEAMALQNVDILRTMEGELGRRMRELRVDGGAAANNLLMQLQSDYLGKDILRPRVIETTVAGACFLGGWVPASGVIPMRWDAFGEWSRHFLPGLVQCREGADCRAGTRQWAVPDQLTESRGGYPLFS